MVMVQISTHLHIIWSMYHCFDNLIGEPPYYMNRFFLVPDKIVVDSYHRQLEYGWCGDVILDKFDYIYRPLGMK